MEAGLRRSRRALVALAVLAILSGAVFALQGLRFLPSRVMYGEPLWVVVGSAMVVGGAIVLWAVRR